MYEYTELQTSATWCGLVQPRVYKSPMYSFLVQPGVGHVARPSPELFRYVLLGVLELICTECAGLV